MDVQLQINSAMDHIDFHLSSPPCEKISLEYKTPELEQMHVAKFV